jgi:Mrp family chromosome partitioning ATPase/capsular polysaccharide biosynthesis protein
VPRAAMTQPNLPQLDQQDTLDIRAYLRPIWRWKFVVLAITILAAVGTYEITKREAKTYVAATSVYVRNADPTASIGLTNGTAPSPPSPQSLEDIATLFTAQNITNSVYQRLHLPVGSAGKVVVTPAATSSFVDVTATSHSPVYAAKLANTYVSVFKASQAASVAAAAASDAKAALATLKFVDAAGGPTKQAQRAALLAEIDQYDTAAANPDSGLTQIDPAVAPAFPSSPNPKRDAIFAAIIGFLLGIGLGFLLERFDRRLGRVSAVQSQYGQPVVAVLPRLSRSPLRGRGHGPRGAPQEFLEPMRSLRVNLRLAGGGEVPRSVLITSAVPSEGKSTVARNLAFACADAGDRVLLIDCDLRRPSIAQVFSVNPEIGLAQVLRREASPAEATVTVFRTGASSQNGSNGSAATRSEPGDPRANGSISVMTHGHIVESPGALLSSPAMSNLLAGATAAYDMVILDTSPILTVSDAVPLLDQVGAVVFVARLAMTTRDAAGRLMELSVRVPKMNMVGVVVNDVRDRFLDDGYGYAGKYGGAYTKANL